jgi:preprotein translocase subunit SecB
MPIQKKLQSTQLDSAYAAFIRELDLVAVGLKSCSSQIDRVSFFKLGRGPKKSLKVFTQDYQLGTVGKNYFDAEGRFSVAITEAEKSKPALLIEFTYLAHVHCPEPVPKAMAERFCKSELRLVLVPYARQFVSTLTGQMSIPPVVLPLTVRQLS